MAERDPVRTRAKVIAAATEEFATHGLAGSRVDRIAQAAQVNKSLMYHHFGGKEALFDIVFDAYVQRNMSTVPLDPWHLPEWAAALYDYYLANPTLVRLLTWARLERTPGGDLYIHSGGIDRRVIDRIVDAQQAGDLIDSVEALDLFSLVIAMAAAWAQASITVAASPGDPKPDHDRRRAALANAVRRAFCNAAAPTGED